VVVVERREALTLLGTTGRVTGLRIRARDGEDGEDVLHAELVVAATGRSARVPSWLAALGHAPPAEEKLAVDLAYASRPLLLQPGALGSDKLAAFTARPGCARGLTLLAQEGERWLLTVSGYGGDRPPTDTEGLLAFAAPVVSPDVLAAIRDAQPLGETSTHAFPSNHRRRYEKLTSFPEGLLVIGDAISSFNPVYGQGLSVAALEALELRRCLRGGGPRLAARYFQAASRIVDRAWGLSVGSDLALPEVVAPRSTRVRVLSAYARRVQVAAERDAAVASAFLRVLGLQAPPTLLMRPNIALRVLAGGPGARRAVRVICAKVAPGRWGRVRGSRREARQ
jgi:2-polyprenyl-6-methoxyphenol hydroxylase-like FAD-dependent oxidoreductase